MIEDIGELHETNFAEIALPFEWKGKKVLLKREDEWEVNDSNQNVFRGLTSQIAGIRNGDTFRSEFYKNGKELTVITVQNYGDFGLWTLVTAEDIIDESYGI